MGLSRRHTECVLPPLHLLNIGYAPQHEPEAPVIDEAAAGHHPRILRRVELTELLLKHFPDDNRELAELIGRTARFEVRYNAELPFNGHTTT